MAVRAYVVAIRILMATLASDLCVRGGWRVSRRPDTLNLNRIDTAPARLTADSMQGFAQHPNPSVVKTIFWLYMALYNIDCLPHVQVASS